MISSFLLNQGTTVCKSEGVNYENSILIGEFSQAGLSIIIHAHNYYTSCEIFDFF